MRTRSTADTSARDGLGGASGGCGPVPGVDSSHVLQLLPDHCPRPRKTLLYFAGLAFVALMMLLLPAIYVGIIAAVAYATYHHATADTWILDGPAGGMRFKLLAYGGPILVGLIVLFFLFKPLLIGRQKQLRPLALQRDRQPGLFAYVQRLSRLLGAPMPRTIALDSRVNAAAGFRRGAWSMIGSDLALTVGAPLVDGMTLRQFTGILAHELGHFAQGGGMRLAYVVRGINFWFARVVYERDAMDRGLERACEAGRYSLWTGVVYGARGAVWVARRILWCLMIAGHGISCFLMRQMEYDADRHMALLAGSDGVESALRRLGTLGAGAGIANSELNRFWAARRLPDNFSAFILSNVERLTDQQREELWRNQLAARTRPLDTHPSDSARIARAREAALPPLLPDEIPAGILFRDWPELCRSLTRHEFTSLSRGAVKAENFVPTEELLGDMRRSWESWAILERYFLRLVTPEQPIFPGALPEISAAAQLVTELTQTRERIGAAADEPRTVVHDLLQKRLVLGLRLAEASAAAGPAADRPAADPTGDTRVVPARDRLLQLLTLEPHFRTARRLADSIRLLQGLLQQHATRGAEAWYGPRLMEVNRECWTALQALQAGMANLRYPFKHAQEGCTCAGYAVPHLPPQQDLGAVLNAGAHAVNCMTGLYFELLAELAAVAEEAERRAGLEPIAFASERREGA